MKRFGGRVRVVNGGLARLKVVHRGIGGGGLRVPVPRPHRDKQVFEFVCSICL